GKYARASWWPYLLPAARVRTSWGLPHGPTTRQRGASSRPALRPSARRVRPTVSPTPSTRPPIVARIDGAIRDRATGRPRGRARAAVLRPRPRRGRREREIDRGGRPQRPSRLRSVPPVAAERR